jgi:mRNA interferase YafQ
MRKIEQTNAFEKDFKRELAGQHGKKLDALLTVAVNLLADDKPMPAAYHDHPLSGEWKNHRDCHLRPDLVLIYLKPDAATLRLSRLGSHSELFG